MADRARARTARSARRADDRAARLLARAGRARAGADRRPGRRADRPRGRRARAVRHARPPPSAGAARLAATMFDREPAQRRPRRHLLHDAPQQRPARARAARRGGRAVPCATRRAAQPLRDARARSIPLLGGAAVAGRASDPVLVERARPARLRAPPRRARRPGRRVRRRASSTRACGRRTARPCRASGSPRVARRRRRRSVLEVPAGEGFAVGDLVDAATERPIRYGGADRRARAAARLLPRERAGAARSRAGSSRPRTRRAVRAATCARCRGARWAAVSVAPRRPDPGGHPLPQRRAAGAVLAAAAARRRARRRARGRARARSPSCCACSPRCAPGEVRELRGQPAAGVEATRATFDGLAALVGYGRSLFDPPSRPAAHDARATRLPRLPAARGDAFPAIPWAGATRRPARPTSRSSSPARPRRRSTAPPSRSGS